MKINAFQTSLDATSRARKFETRVDPSLRSFRELLRYSREAADQAREEDRRVTSPEEKTVREPKRPAATESPRTTRTWTA